MFAASRALGCDVAQVLDFSASINPLGPPPTVWRAIRHARGLLAHYPDPECLELRQTLAERWGCQPRHLVVGNGSMELIDALPTALDLHNLLVVQPTFSEYAASMARAGRTVTVVRARRAERYAIPILRLRREVVRAGKRPRGIDGLVLCNPNSPSGGICNRQDLIELLRLAQRRGVWAIVDESFADFYPDCSVLPRSLSWSRVVVLRSLTKFYSLPGLRVGYAVAAPPVVQAIRRVLAPWSVNVLGQVAAVAALRDPAYAGKSLAFMGRERERLTQQLASVPGCSVYPAQANFLFVELGSRWNATAVVAHLRRQGVLIRDCSTVPGVERQAIRVAVRRRRDNDRLVAAMRDALKGGGR